MAATVVIPARYASTRFPGKMLAARTGRPLVQHVVDRVRMCKRVAQIIVATDDQRIVEALRPFETDARITSASHQSGTDRIWEIVQNFEPGSIIVNVQGDEPEIEPEIVDRLIKNVQEADQRELMATVATPFPAGADPDDPNLVKVVIGVMDNRALYFSRSRIPYLREKDSTDQPPYYLHLGIYAYTYEFLRHFVKWQPSPLERAERLEQLRALENGRPIFVLKTDRATHGIDTPEQYEAFVQRLRNQNGE